MAADHIVIDKIFKIAIKVKNFDKVAVCKNCGKNLELINLRVLTIANETGFFYCDSDCALEHVALVEKINGGGQ